MNREIKHSDLEVIPVEISADWSRRISSFENAHFWTTAFSHTWTLTEHINSLEAAAVVLALEWAVYFPVVGQRTLMVSDSLVIIGALNKGRSSSLRLSMYCRRFASLCIARDIQTHLCYVPSGCNPADAPSRLGFILSLNAVAVLESRIRRKRQNYRSVERAAPRGGQSSLVTIIAERLLRDRHLRYPRVIRRPITHLSTFVTLWSTPGLSPIIPNEAGSQREPPLSPISDLHMGVEAHLSTPLPRVSESRFLDDFFLRHPLIGATLKPRTRNVYDRALESFVQIMQPKCASVESLDTVLPEYIEECYNLKPTAGKRLEMSYLLSCWCSHTSANHSGWLS